MANIQIFGNILACTHPVYPDDLATKGYVDSVANSNKKIMTVLSGTSVAPTQCGQVLLKNVTANTTLTFNSSGATVNNGELYGFDLILNISSGTVTFPSGWVWCNGTAPSTAIGGLFSIYIFTTDGGTTWYAEQTGHYPASGQLWLTVRTTAANQEISIENAYTGEILPTPVKIDWGDGTTNTYSKGTISHTYTTAGTRRVIVGSSTGILPMMWFMDVDWLISVDWCDVEWYDYGDTVSFSSMFTGCSSLTGVPDTLFAKNPSSSLFDSCFEGCTSLVAVPQNLFGTRSTVDIGSCFKDCTSLVYVPSSLLSGCTTVYGSRTFKGCSSLTSIPHGLFKSSSTVIDFSESFMGCSSLTSIPGDLFAYCSAARNFDSCFQGCSGLTSIPSTLFDNVSTTNCKFLQCFSGCTALTTIPTDLFDHIVSGNFLNCFAGCTSWVADTSSPYVPQIWNKDTQPINSGAYYSYVSGLAPSTTLAYIPYQWGGTLQRYNPSTTYAEGDIVYYPVPSNGTGYANNVKVYVCTATSTGNAPTNSSYWHEGYDLPSTATSVITFKKQKAGIGLNYYDLNYENGTYTITDDTPPISWTPGSFNSQTLSGTKSSGSANALMVSSWSLSGGVLRITLGAMASQMGLSSGTVLTFGGFVESEDSEWYYATSSTFS